MSYPEHNIRADVLMVNVYAWHDAVAWNKQKDSENIDLEQHDRASIWFEMRLRLRWQPGELKLAGRI